MGGESTFPATLTNATGKSLGLILRHFGPKSFLSSAWNGTQSLTLIDGQGKETAGLRQFINFDTALVDEMTKVTAEQILWEFPSSTEKELRFRLYDTNAANKIVTTNDFSIVIPASK